MTDFGALYWLRKFRMYYVNSKKPRPNLLIRIYWDHLKFIKTSRCAGLRCEAYERFAFAWDALRGVLPALYNLLAFNNFNFNVYGVIDNKNIRRNRIGQNFGEDNGSLVCKAKLLNHFGVTAPIESLHNFYWNSQIW